MIHNHEVAGSIPAPATVMTHDKPLMSKGMSGFVVCRRNEKTAEKAVTVNVRD